MHPLNTTCDRACWALTMWLCAGLMACSAESAGPLADAEIPSEDTGSEGTVCWVPEDAPSDLLDCEKLCQSLSRCEPEDSGCAEECPVLAKYLEEAAAQPLMDCVENTACGDDLLFQCMETIVSSGDLSASPEKVAECTNVQEKSTECEGPVDELLESCDLFSALFTLAAMEQIGSCAAEDCGDLRSCLEAANCMLEEEVPRGSDRPQAVD